MPTNYIYLTGGLGNQLFQYSALKTFQTNHDLVIDVVNGKPRINQKLIPDILEFNLSEKISTHDRHMQVLTQKAIGYSLRSHLDPKGLEHLKLWRKVSRFGADVLLSLHFRKIIFIRVSSDLGDDTKLKLTRSNNFLVGYFQSHRWAGSIKNSKTLPFLINTSAKIEGYRKLAKLEEPLVVHIRLGDYAVEGGFGIPGTRYYEEALTKQFRLKQYEKIWLFSDEPEKALEIFPSKFQDKIRVIDQDFSSAETLELMRLGAGYVIGNSTFSWWGAYLSYTRDPLVIYPYPWFRALPAPTNLVPKDWVSSNAHF
jgi:hypothetical protein